MQFDVFIACMMRPNPDIQNRCERAGLSATDLSAARERAIQVGLLGRAVSREAYRKEFGDPEIETDSNWLYRMELWPQHLFEIGVVDGLISLGGFALREQPRVASTSLTSVAEIRQRLRVGYHTSAEIQAGLGAPYHVSGWERMEDWHYRLKSGEELVLGFDFELLGAIADR